jgi:hypothetical protein
MLTIVVGFKTPSYDSDATCIYCGNDVDAAQKAISAIKEDHFSHVRQFNNPNGFPVRIPTAAELAAEKKAHAASVARDKAKKEKAEAEAAARTAAANPTAKTAATASKEAAEAEAAEAKAKAAEAEAAEAKKKIRS